MQKVPIYLICSVLGGFTTHCVPSSPPLASPPHHKVQPNEPVRKPYSPEVAGASGEAEAAIKGIRVPQGLQITLFAAEPLLANPVSFCIDERNRFYVAETFRIHHGVEDDREHMNWLDDDLAGRTVDDRVAMYKKHLGSRAAAYAVEHERIRLIEDTTGSGKADRSTVFADGFNGMADGIGAGLLARGGNVWYTCIPNLWLLCDTKGTGKADFRKALHYGYGVHVSFYGHDLHGLRFGPDGKLYFSIGDRGSSIKTDGRMLANPDTGSVFRCNPDGSDLEVVATGLRNPQELAFDQYGNLFTGDNNADGGDKARWVYVVEGGDSGWRIGYQYMNNPGPLGPWNAEKLWLPHWDGQAAYIVPPIANVADGPAGLVYYPGTGLSERYRGHFFLCDFRGSSSNSGIRSFAVKPRGASFEFIDQHEYVWSILATDVDFGTDGAMYILDWIDGWSGTKKGRIYKIVDPTQTRDPAVLSVKKLMAEGMAQRSLDELAKLLEHADTRIRQEAQFALAAKGPTAVTTLIRVTQTSSPQLARLHAIWGLGQLGRKSTKAYQPLLTLLTDPDAEVRVQACKVLGDGRVAAAHDKLRVRLGDNDPRVRFFAMMGLGKLGRADAIAPILNVLRENADQDAYLRHAGVMALTWIKDVAALRLAAKDSSPAVRMAALLALRRLQSPDVAQFLSDPEPLLVLEAARAIYDVPIPAALPQLAALIERTKSPEPLLYRVLNAHFRLGQAENAAAVAHFAADGKQPDALRVEALRELSDWAEPSGRDRIVGLWRPLGPRPSALAADALRPYLRVICQSSDSIRQEGIRAAARLHLKESGPLLLGMVADKNLSPAARLESLKALEALGDERLIEAMKVALDQGDPSLRAHARRIQVKLDPAGAVAILEGALVGGAVIEQQEALALLGDMKEPAADVILARWLDKLLAKKVRLEIQLDLLEAARRRSSSEIKEKLGRHDAARPKSDPLANYREVLAGGNIQAGRKIFYEKAEVTCLRCHKINGTGGEVGPDLTGIGKRQNREYLLESIVDPNKDIAKGFETVVLTTLTGKVHIGIVKAEDDKVVRIITAEGNLVNVPKKAIEVRSRGKSPMPEDVVKFLTKADLRDLVEFLASLK